MLTGMNSSWEIFMARVPLEENHSIEDRREENEPHLGVQSRRPKRVRSARSTWVERALPRTLFPGRSPREGILIRRLRQTPPGDRALRLGFLSQFVLQKRKSTSPSGRSVQSTVPHS